MKDYLSQPPKTQFSKENSNMISSMEEIEYGVNNIHTVENSYSQQKKLKEILNKNLH